MGSLTTWLRLYCLLKIIVNLDSYVLLAANADDFRNIAKQIVPGALANKLARLASASAKKNTDRSDESEYYYETEMEADEDTKEDSVIENVKDYERSREDMYVNEWKTRVNFDELVERVKDRLAKEITEKLKKQVWDPKQSMYNGFNQKGAQDENIMNSAKNVNYDNIPQNNLKNKKTYGYNNSKNNFKPDNGPQNTNFFNNPDFQIDPQISPLKNIDQDKESLENNKYVFNGENIQEAQISNTYVDVNSREKEYYNNGKPSNQMKHEEGNNMFHLQNNKDVSSDAGQRQKIQNGDFGKQYAIINGNFPKPAEKYNSEINIKGVGPVEHNNENVFKQFNTNQKVFDGTYNVDNNKPALYEEFDLVSKRKNDSYEDYVIPKSENKYASDETSTPVNHDRAKLKKNLANHNEKSGFKLQSYDKFQNLRPVKHEAHHIKTEDEIQDYTEVTDKSQEIKAKTESLLYNYDEVEPKTTKHSHFKVRKTVSSTTKKPRGKGTMIPTREHYKMASPNYYISIPTVVEKYDPNEPLPEKDRQREIIKHFVNPPASINRKIKLT